MSKAKFTTNGVLVFPDLGKEGKVTGPFPGLSVTAKRTIKDVEFSLTVPTAKAAKEQSLNGTLLSLKNTWSEQYSYFNTNGHRHNKTCPVRVHKYSNAVEWIAGSLVPLNSRQRISLASMGLHASTP